MVKPLPPLSKARILISNDDGIGAPGIKALERIARTLSSDVWVVAPEAEQSATSHSLTLRRPLRVRKLAPRRFSVDGTPTDCVLVACRNILRDHPPDLVLSGINMGSNLGEDVTYSGTVAAAMEGAVLGIAAIAFSQERDRKGALHFGAAEHHGPKIIKKLWQVTWRRDLLFNVNFPARAAEAVAGIRVCRQGRRQEGSEVIEGRDPSGRPYVWIGNYLSEAAVEEDTDLGAVAAGAIAVTPLHLDLSHQATLKAMGEKL